MKKITKEYLLSVGFTEDVWYKKKFKSSDWGDVEFSISVGNEASVLVITQDIHQGFTIKKVAEIINSDPEMADANFVLRFGTIALPPIQYIKDLEFLVFIITRQKISVAG